MNSKELRKNILINSYKAGACHLGSALSCVEILLAIFQTKRNKDYFLFSKASGVSAFYCLLGEMGVISKLNILNFLKNHPLPDKHVPGVIHSVGSLGHGLNVAVGIAYADRSKNVYCLISDGEFNEGSTWEAILFAAHHKLNNLIVVCDFNNFQACGRTQDILKLEDISKKMEAFNWSCNRCDGHDINYINLYLTKHDFFPTMTICDTVKGKGVDFMEHKYEWHYRNLDNLLLQRALKQL